MTHKNLSKIAFAAIILGTGLVLSACNTTEGLGKDMESLGKSTQETAKEHK